MRIAATGPSASVAAGGARRPASSGFDPALGSTPPAGVAARAGAAGPVAGLDALLALQEEGGPTERRRRAMRRAGVLLDGLDALRLSLVAGDAPGAALAALQQAVREHREELHDAGLDAVLDAIDTRAAVELAKQEIAAQP